MTIPVLGLEQHSWAYERKMQRRQAIAEAFALVIWVLVLCAMLAASFYFGYANGANATPKPIIEHNTTSIHQLPDLQER